MAVSCTPVPVRSHRVMASWLVAAGRLPGDHLAEFREGSIRRDQAGLDGVVQFAEAARLREAVGDVGNPGQDGGLDLVLVLGIRAHRGDVLAGLQPLGPQDRVVRPASW